MKGLILIILLALSIAGCGTTPDKSASFSEVFKEPTELGKGRVIFYRPNTRPFSFTMQAFIGDIEIASLPNRTFSWVDLDEGKYTINIIWHDWSGRMIRPYEINIVAGSEVYVEYIRPLSPSENFDPVAINVYGTEELQNQKGASKEKEKIQKCCRYHQI
ncbi:MAG: hypothetical protein AAF353_12640 [Pseudomonadota bacterium]